MFAGKFGEFFDGVNRSVWKGRCGAHNDDGVICNCFFGFAYICFTPFVHGNALHVYIEILRRFVEGCMGCSGDDHLRFGNSSHVPRPVAVGFHGQQDTLGATGRNHAADFIIAIRIFSYIVGIEHVGGHRDHFGLVLRGARPYIGMQWIALGIENIDLIQKVDMIFITVIHRTGDESVFPFGLFFGVQGFHFFDNFFFFATVFRKTGEGLKILAVRFN